MQLHPMILSITLLLIMACLLSNACVAPFAAPTPSICTQLQTIVDASVRSRTGQTQPYAQP